MAFKKPKNVVNIRIQSESLKMWINLKKGQLLDEKGLTRDVSHSGHWIFAGFWVSFRVVFGGGDSDVVR